MNTKTISLISGLLLPLAASPVFGAEKVYVYNWTEYLPATVLEQFTAETGIEVI